MHEQKGGAPIDSYPSTNKVQLERHPDMQLATGAKHLSFMQFLT